MVPKHRRSEIEPSLASVRAPGNTAEYWPEAVGYGPVGVRAGHAVTDYPLPDGYDGAAVEPAWARDPQGHSWQEREWEDWRDWPPPPVLHPDHPSAPVPRVLFPADHPSRPHGPDAGYDSGYRRLHAVRDDYFEPQPGPGWQEPVDYRRETGPFGPGGGPATGWFQDGRSSGSDSRWTAEQVLALADGRAAQIERDAQDYATAMREAAQREAAAITQQAADQAATMHEVAEREAAAIREAAERAAAAMTQQATGQAATIRESAEQETAELRSRLDSMTGELGRVAAYVSETLGAPPMPTTSPAIPEAMPALPGTRPARPATTPTRPATRQAEPAKPRTAPTSQPREPGTRIAKPGSAPGTRTATPGTAPRTKPDGPARQAATPAKSGQTQGRQRRAIRIATAGTAALLSVAAAGAITMTGIHGFRFFVFRESGQGETPGNFTDLNFLTGQKECAGAVVCPAAQQHDSAPKAAQHNDSAPKGRHHKATVSQ
ncbi:MAG TPA: hypothetical protein VMA72_26245 [Streptosporangiaceae bacterium]|nr:hypothetical protein [Streptosporangiaceae bacterium]